MRFGRLGRFGATLLVLQLAYVTRASADLTCREHDGRSVASAQNGESEHHHSQGESPDAPKPGNAPLGDCCPAMTSCSTAVALATPRMTGTAQGSTALHRSFLSTLFVSRVEAPDPPPPKA